MKLSIRKGFSYGLTSGVITTLGLLVGLFAGTNSKQVVLAGVITIAFADAFSDALGIHVSEESENEHSKREIWESTIATVLTKMVLGLSFALPLLVFDLTLAAMIDVFWGVAVLSALSTKIAAQNNEKKSRVLFEHLGIALLVIIVSYLIGGFVKDRIR